MSESKANTKTDMNTSTRRNDDSEPAVEQGSPTVDLYCAISRPDFGTRYHWALVTNHREQTDKQQWYVFHAIQEKDGGPYVRNQRQGHPRECLKHVQSLKFLGQMRTDRWDCLTRAIPTIMVPGEAGTWSCQDYVIEIWGLLQKDGVIDDATWNQGYEELLPHYGQDFDGKIEESDEDDEQRD